MRKTLNVTLGKSELEENYCFAFQISLKRKQNYFPPLPGFVFVLLPSVSMAYNLVGRRQLNFCKISTGLLLKT